MLANVCQLRDRCVTLQSVVPLEATQKNWQYIQLKYLPDYSSLYSLHITHLLLAIISPHRQTIIAGIYSNQKRYSTSITKKNHSKHYEVAPF